MTKNISLLTRTLIQVLVLLFSISSCYNKISDELLESDIPILITSNIKPAITRVANNQFESNDAMGFFLVPNGRSFKEAFASNSKFEYKVGKDFVPEKTIYYPKTEDLSSIFCYYPYRKDAFMSEVGKLRVDIPNKQDTYEVLNNSSFLVAHKEDVYADIKPQKLSFKHQLAKVELLIKPATGYSAEEIIKISPKVVINGMPTSALYDPSTFIYSDLSQTKAIKPLINWKIQDELIVGSEFIAIPQGSLDNASIEIVAEKITYTCSFPKDFILEPGTLNKLIIKYTPSKGIEIINSESSIEKWTEGKIGETEATHLSKAMSFNQFNFEETNVIQLLNSDNVSRAEVCLELLHNKDISTQAVVVYPIDADGKRSSRGLCLKALDEQYNIDGNAIVWNDISNTFNIEKVESNYRGYFFISTEGEILTEETSSTELLHAKKLFMVHQGVRYPLVKVGADTWLASNLRATKKLDGSLLAYELSTVMINAGYTTEKDYPNNFLYNRAAIESQNLIPSGWKLASEKHWQRLMDYIEKDFSMLKGGDLWSHTPANNKSYFNLLRTGCYTSRKYFNVSNAFWIYEKTAFKLFFVNDHSEKFYEFREVSTNDIMASVRCVRD